MATKPKRQPPRKSAKVQATGSSFLPVSKKEIEAHEAFLKVREAEDAKWLAAGDSDTPRDSSDEKSRPVLDGNMETVFYKLFDSQHRLLTAQQISGKAIMHRTTVGEALDKLAEVGLCHQPRGTRKGWALTRGGIKFGEALVAARH